MHDPLVHPPQLPGQGAGRTQKMYDVPLDLTLLDKLLGFREDLVERRNCGAHGWVHHQRPVVPEPLELRREQRDGASHLLAILLVLLNIFRCLLDCLRSIDDAHERVPPVSDPFVGVRDARDDNEEYYASKKLNEHGLDTNLTYPASKVLLPHPPIELSASYSMVWWPPSLLE